MPYIKNIWQIKSLSNLLNVLLHFGFTISFKKMGKEKKMIPICGKKQTKNKVVLPQ